MPSSRRLPDPDLFAERGIVSVNRTVLFALLSVLVLAGFGFRVTGLSAEGLSEDELNKLQAVAEYREQGLTSANSEHPLLMKALLTGSVVFADKWNSIPSLGGRTPISPETALRFPAALFGALTVVLIYLLAAELFGAEVGLIAAALWAFDPMAIGFNRIAKEDTFLVFFFLLGNIFWLRGQRVAETKSTEPGRKILLGRRRGIRRDDGFEISAATRGHRNHLLLHLSGSAGNALAARQETLTEILRAHGVVFVLLNPTILFPPPGIRWVCSPDKN